MKGEREVGISNISGRALSIPSGLALGAAVSTVITVLVSFIGAQMIMNQVLPQEQIGYCSMAALLSGTILGAMTAAGKIKHRKLLVCMLSGVVFLCILLAATAMFFGGQYEGFGVTAITVLLGCVAAAILTNGKGRRHSKQKHKKR